MTSEPLVFEMRERCADLSLQEIFKLKKEHELRADKDLQELEQSEDIVRQPSIIR